MSETLFKILLSEIHAVRIICQRVDNGNPPCGGIVEVSLDNLHKVNRCPVCHEEMLAPGTHLFSNLKHAILNLAAAEQKKAQVELVVRSDRHL